MLFIGKEQPVSVVLELLEIPTAVGRLFHTHDVKLTVWSWCKGSGNHQSNGDGWTVDYRRQQENNKKIWQKATTEGYNDRSCKDASFPYIMNKQE